MTARVPRVFAFIQQHIIIALHVLHELLAKLRNETASSTKSILMTITVHVTTITTRSTKRVITSFEQSVIPFLVQYLQDNYNTMIISTTRRNKRLITTKTHKNSYYLFCLPQQYIDSRKRMRNCVYPGSGP